MCVGGWLRAKSNRRHSDLQIEPRYIRVTMSNAVIQNFSEADIDPVLIDSVWCGATVRTDKQWVDLKAASTAL